MSGRRRFGGLRKLPSGRWQASYCDPDGQRRFAPDTFATKRAGEQWLNVTETDLLRGEWLNPDDHRVSLSEFGNRWIKERPGLRPRTFGLYQSLFRKHIEPRLGKVAVGDLTTARVRTWRTGLLDLGVSATTTAKAYRLLRSILMTAADDGVIARNPCRIRGAGTEPTPERPVLSVVQVSELAVRLPEPFGLMALVTTYGSLRWGEVTALRRNDFDPLSGVVRIRTAFSRDYSGKIQRGAPKSRAGHRAVVLPRPIADRLSAHLDGGRVGDDEEALIFPGDKGGPLHRSNFNKRVSWPENVAAIAAPGLHFHDLRHTGNTLAATTGASLRDLMTRMGHDSMRAALIYQHNTEGADRKIADALEALLTTEALLSPPGELPEDTSVRAEAVAAEPTDVARELHEAADDGGSDDDRYGGQVL
jgi:integrase